MDIRPNIVVCPNCESSFAHNRVNGLALLEIADMVNKRERMHCRLTLDAIERELKGPIPRNIKKAILDGYNDLGRDILTALGLGNDAE